MQGVSPDAQNPLPDRGLEWKQSPVAGCQRRGLLITNSLYEAGRLYYIKAFLEHIPFICDFDNFRWVRTSRLVEYIANH